MKKILAILVAVSLIFTFAACNNNSNSEETTTVPTSNEAEETTTLTGSEADTSTEPSSETTTAGEIPSGQETTAALTEQTTLAADPAQWTDEEIVEFYKAAATKTHPTTQYSQTMTLDRMVVNEGDGALGFVIKIAKPAIAAVLEKNSTTIDGITGGYKDLVVSDAKSIKAYKSGNYTVVEMTMKDQTDGKHGHNMSGTVGHAITVLGDVSVAVAEFPQFDIDTENADIKIKYHNATVKVKINQNGIIEKGTWKYTADVDIKNLTIKPITVKTADAAIGYDITVGGGF